MSFQATRGGVLDPAPKGDFTICSKIVGLKGGNSNILNKNPYRVVPLVLGYS